MGATVAAHKSHASGIKAGVESSTVLYHLLAVTHDRHHGTIIDPTIHAAAAMRRARGLQDKQGKTYQADDNGQ